METYSIKRCRVCGSEKLSKLFSLGNLYISTFVKKKGDNIGKAPLELLYCDKCTLVQLKHTAPQELMYSGNYWYESSLNSVIVNDLKEIVSKAKKYHKEGVWIDVGANDGTLLGFVGSKFYKVGVEPAKNLQKRLLKTSDKVIKKMWEDVITNKAQVITAIGMFYDSENPNIFISNIKDHLTEDGIFIAQMMTSKAMLVKNDVGNICHEHLEFYSYKSLKYLFESNGLEIFKVEENSINGGSYRLYARLFRNGSVSHSERITKRDYLAFASRIEKNKKDCLRFIKSQVGKKIYGYGASTKGNTILQYYGLTSKDLRGIAEIHPQKLGKLTVGTHIPILEEKEAKADADYLLVLPYAFKDNFIKRNKEWLKNGGKLVFTTPKLEIYG